MMAARKSHFLIQKEKIPACFSQNLCQDIDMHCPFCSSSQVMVINSRPTANHSQIWRRRKCLDCAGIFTSYEKMDLSHLVVVKKSGKHQKFNRAKLYSGIYHSFLDKKGVDRGQAASLSETITNEAERKMTSLRQKNIGSGEIIDIVAEILGKKAPDALLRYLAYRKGGDLRKLKKYLRNLP